MDIRIRKIGEEEKEYIEIGCLEKTAKISEIVRFVKGLEGTVGGSIGQKQFEIPIVDIYYIESVDNRTFIYSSDKTYETNRKLYEFEELLRERNFLRISKSTVLNVMKARSVKPALNGRFSCILQNGEEVIISRKYVSQFREFIGRRAEGKR